MDEIVITNSGVQSSLVKKVFHFFKRYSLQSTVLVLMLGTFVTLWILVSAPRTFPTPTLFTISRGASLMTISNTLKESHIIRSERVLEIFVILFGGDQSLPAGTYAFEKKMPVYEVAWRIAHGTYGIAQKKITIPEGASVYDIGLMAEKSLIGFDKELFYSLADDKEGYLFPDTYYLFLNTTPEELIAVMEKNFLTRTASLETAIAASGRTRKDVIIMASLLELEASDSAQRRVISGILWKRLDDGMRLQVDAPFFYLRQGSTELEVTQADLTTDSPYNTYRNDGLPPGPIGNPGLDAIVAALTPEPSPYWYYLHDKTGMIYYARTFAEHKANKERYLWNN
ncbi:MAG: endolytic transglycosylase MltG [Candidatus Pacebacteria bacterium]|jgi:UPF0755 protein|nr:endolytic transglycosylase MltG [Candidatus Paceibacterota bacterium]